MTDTAQVVGDAGDLSAHDQQVLAGLLGETMKKGALKRGFKVLPTRANMFMIDWKSVPAPKMQQAFRAQSVEIGRSWPIWPTVSRVTVGSAEDMKAFCSALDKVWT